MHLEHQQLQNHCSPNSTVHHGSLFHLFLLHSPLTIVKAPITMHPRCMVNCSAKWRVMRSPVDTGRPGCNHAHPWPLHWSLPVTLTAGTDKCWQGSEWERHTAAPLTWANTDVLMTGCQHFGSKEGRAVKRSSDSSIMSRTSMSAEVLHNSHISWKQNLLLKW